jgi:HD-GYP domain-containing protein (c-di-GMP phosphodiesterase class II)
MSPDDGPDLSVCDADQYLEHLAYLAANRNLVVSTTDVYNQFGVLLLKGGTPLGSFAVDKLRGQRLNQPVDGVLELQRRMSTADLVSAFNDLVSGEPDLARIAEHYRCADRLRHLCYRCELPPALLQRLTVLEQNLPRVFHRALFTAWLGTLVAQELALEPEEIELTLLAGLSHDFGLLHLRPDLVDKKRDIDAQQWRQIQRHVVYGALVVESIDALPRRLARIVVQHHERRDGAGYPTGKAGDELDPIGQIMAMTDMIHGLRFQRLLLNSQATLAGCMAFLRVNAVTFGEQNYQAVARVLGHAPAPQGQHGEDLPSTEQLLAVNRSLQVMLERLSSVRGIVETLPATALTRSLLSLARQVQWVCLSSGIGNEVFEFMIRSQSAGGARPADLHDTVLTTREVIWLVRRIDRQLTELAAAEGASLRDTELPDIAEVLHQQLEEAWSNLCETGTG